MSTTEKVEFSNGMNFYIGSFICSPADIIIPVETIKNMSDADIGRISRALCERACELHFYEVAEDGHKYHLGGPDDHIIKLYNEFMEYQGVDVVITSFREKLKEAVDKINTREERKQKKKKLRRDVQSIYNSLFVRIGRRDGFKCVVCGRSDDLQIDHILALENNGGNEISNLQLLCSEHNIKKGAK